MSTWTPYCGSAPLPDELISRWNLDPLLVGALLLLVAWQARQEAQPWRRACFAAAILLLVAVFLSPLCALSSALFAVRATHHVLLAAVAAPLLVLASPPRASRLPGNLLAWTALQALALWLWHAPSVYAAALSSDLVYWGMQGALLGSSLLFWDRVRRAAAPAAAAALAVATVQMGLLGALVTFAPQPLYAPHLLTTAAWGLAPLEDQQIAGLIMWVPASLFYLGAALWLLGRSLVERPATAQLRV
jgi:putative membrane protein